MENNKQISFFDSLKPICPHTKNLCCHPDHFFGLKLCTKCQDNGLVCGCSCPVHKSYKKINDNVLDYFS